MTTLLILLTTHFIGDWILQSDRMALGKSKSFGVLAQHCIVYTFVLTLAGAYVAGRGGVQFGDLLLFGMWTFALHFATDAITSRITSKLWFIQMRPNPKESEWPYFARIVLGRRHWFFVTIGADQLIHFYALAWTYKLCFG